MRDLELLALFVLGLLTVGTIGDAEEWFGDRVYLVEISYLLASVLIGTIWLWIRKRITRR